MVSVSIHIAIETRYMHTKVVLPSPLTLLAGAAECFFSRTGISCRNADRRFSSPLTVWPFNPGEPLPLTAGLAGSRKVVSEILLRFRSGWFFALSES